MDWYEIEVNGQRTVSFAARAPLSKAAGVVPDTAENGYVTHKAGGIIKRGEWAWLATDDVLEIVALHGGQLISTYEFAESKGYENCYIRCVEELTCDASNMLLAVCLESLRATDGGCSFVALYSVADSKVLSCMELRLHITSACFISANCCRRSLLQNFDGCLALGGEEGVIVLLDLNIINVMELARDSAPNDAPMGCQVTDYNLPLAEIHRNFRQCRQDGVHFGLQIEVIDSPCAIQCMLPIDIVLGLAIGLEDGRLAFYDLPELQIFYVAKPLPQQSMVPLVKLNYLEPLDDPRPCLYVCAVHESDQQLYATVHSLMYEKRLMDENNFCYFETFQTSSMRLQLPLEATKSTAIACQAITKVSNSGTFASLNTEDDANCLCALFWYSALEEKNKLLIFDLNQWYKEEMPHIVNSYHPPTYLAGYILNGQQQGMDAYLNPATIAHFNSLQRFEEHFYPNSLSFDCGLLVKDGCRSYTWLGAQNKLINMLRVSSASIFLEPDECYKGISRARLLPQFSESNTSSITTRDNKYETILSVALEHNCYSLLRDCAKSWADGSFMAGNFTASTGISLSTLTDWIWKRATHIKERCNNLCKGLFDYSGYPLDRREQKELGFITRQLKLLAELLGEVIKFSKRYIPSLVFTNLESKYKSLRMASEYQEIILWLLNIGLLPESGTQQNRHCGMYKMSGKRSTGSILYPYAELKTVYAGKRALFGRISENFISKKTGSCRLLFIDAFIEHECKSEMLREYWQENGGNGLYPPTSIEAMLRIMLVPDVEFEGKCAILLYFFLDLHTAIDEQTHKELIASFIKFPSVFKLTASLIKTVQAFWNLDRGNFMPAVEEFISPFHNNQHYPQWMLELLIEALLTQNACKLALRILEARPNIISPVLKLKTLLSNEMIPEAFHFARSKHDESLLEMFFTCCLCAGKYGVIRDLALSEKEGQLVQRILKRSKTHGAENLHFVYLLQKSKYIEAVSYLDELSRSKSLRSQYGDANGSTDTPNLVLSAYNTTMAPVTQGLTDVYFRIRNKIKKKEMDNKSPVPLSCQLIKQNANGLLGGIYHSSALSAHFATYYWGEMDAKKHDGLSVLSSNNAPFLRKPQVETKIMDYTEKPNISYPQPYKASEKRTLAESELHDNGELVDGSQSVLIENPKKRRRLLAEEIVKDLSHFMEAKKSSSRLNVSEANFMEASTSKAGTIDRVDSTPKKTVAEGSSIDFLTQPLATPRRRLAMESDFISPAVKSVASSELHSILKTKTPERTVRGQSVRRDLAADEGKNLRFNLPVEHINQAEEVHSREQETSEVKPRIFTTTEVVSADEEEEEDLEIVVEVKQVEPDEETTEKYKEVARAMSVDSSEENEGGYKEVVRAVSVESNESDISGSKAGIEESFYSPLSSQQNSMVVDSPISATKLTARHELFAGPQPRKPLARLSAERTERSPTPIQESLIPSTTDEHKKTDIEGLQPRKSIFDLKPQTSTSSGYVSIETKNSTTSVKLMDNKSLDFTPKSSSSKLSEQQSQFMAPSRVYSSTVKLSECTTVVGGLTHMETTESKLVTSMGNVKPNDKPDSHKMYETTLGMSSCDFTIDATLLGVNETEPSTVMNEEMRKTEYVLAESREKEEIVAEEVSYKSVISDDLYDVALNIGQGTKDESDEPMELSEDVEVQPPASRNTDPNLKSNDPMEYEHSKSGSESEAAAEDVHEDEDSDVIVLSSGSSSGSVETGSDLLLEKDNVESVNASVCGEEEEDSDDNKYDDEDEDEDEESENYDVEGENSGDVDIDNETSDEEAQETKNDNEEMNSESSSSVVAVEDVPEEEDNASNDTSGTDQEKSEAVKSNDSEQEEDSDEGMLWGDVLVEEIFGELSRSSIEVLNIDAAIVEEFSDAGSEEEYGEQERSVRIVKIHNEEIHIEEMRESEEDGEKIEASCSKTITKMVVETVEKESEEDEKQGAESKEDGEKIEVTCSKTITEIVLETVKKKCEDELQKTQSEDEGETLKASNTNAITEIVLETVVEKSLTTKETKEIKANEKDDEKQPDLTAPKTDSEIQEPGEAEASEAEEHISLHVDEEDVEVSDMDVDEISPCKDNKEGQSELENKQETIEVIANEEPEQKTEVIPTDTDQLKPSVPRPDSGNDIPSTPIKRRGLRSTSVPPDSLETDSNIESSNTARRNTRGISIPPQVITEQEGSEPHTPRTRRLSKLTEETAPTSGTPRTRRGVRGTSVPHDKPESTEMVSTPTRTGRGSSLPPAAKIVTRRRSALLEAINENTPVLDSPSTRTRSRVRLSSMESDLDTSVLSGEHGTAKRARRTSLSSSVSEQPHTPRRSRRLSVADGEAERVDTPREGIRTRAHDSAEKDKEVKTKTQSPKEEEQSPVNEEATTSMLYSSSRRLTRTQLAMMEKSAALQKAHMGGQKDMSLISPPTVKRVAKRRSSRSTATPAPDSDVESLSSHVSNVSNPSKRRVTRSSVRDKDEMEDDLVSVASSMGSERLRKRRSKDDKTSPTLTTITEDEGEEQVERKKRGRATKK